MEAEAESSNSQGQGQSHVKVEADTLHTTVQSTSDARLLEQIHAVSRDVLSLERFVAKFPHSMDLQPLLLQARATLETLENELNTRHTPTLKRRRTMHD